MQLLKKKGGEEYDLYDLIRSDFHCIITNSKERGKYKKKLPSVEKTKKNKKIYMYTHTHICTYAHMHTYTYKIRLCV